MLFKTGIITY